LILLISIHSSIPNSRIGSPFFRLAAVFMGGEYENPLSKPVNDFGKWLIGPIAQKDRAAVS
jgi:hypothetical protein